MTIYDDLGVRTLINARGCATLAGGTLMEPEVVAAMADGGRVVRPDRRPPGARQPADRRPDRGRGRLRHVRGGRRPDPRCGGHARPARPGPHGAPARGRRRAGRDRRPGQPSQSVRPPRPGVGSAPRRVRRCRAARRVEAMEACHRAGDGRCLLPRPGGGGRPVDRRLRGDRPRARRCRCSSTRR